MIDKISQEIRNTLLNLSTEDRIIFANKLIEINQNNFQAIPEEVSDKTIAFVDGGQAEIISAGNFCLSFIRVFAQVFQGKKKLNSYQNEFYLLTAAEWKDNDLFYESKMFPLGEKLIDEKDLSISSYDSSIREGTERASISKISNMARRFAELSLAGKITADFVVLDGTLTPTFRNEKKFLNNLSTNICALAKTSSLFTVSGDNPVQSLNKLGPMGCWNYHLENKTNFVKLHEKAKHVFRFEGNQEALPLLVKNSCDSLFLGYPYGLIFADKFARISNEEKKSLKTNFLLRAENGEIVSYLNSANAHEILDNLS